MAIKTTSAIPPATGPQHSWNPITRRCRYCETDQESFVKSPTPLPCMTEQKHHRWDLGHGARGDGRRFTLYTAARHAMQRCADCGELEARDELFQDYETEVLVCEGCADHTECTECEGTGLDQYHAKHGAEFNCVDCGGRGLAYDTPLKAVRRARGTVA